MTEPIVSGSLVSNKTNTLSVFPEGYSTLNHPLRPNELKAVMANEGAFYTPQTATSLSLAPSQAANLASLGTAAPGFVQFQVGSDIRIDRIDSAKITVTLRNPSAVTACYVAPSPFWFDAVTMSLSSSASDPLWTDNYVAHRGILQMMEREICLKVVGEEGFQFVAAEDTSQITLTSPTVGNLIDNPVLYPGIVLAPLESRVISYYLLASPMTAPGFHPAILRGANKLSIRFSFSQGTNWLSSAGAAVVDSCSFVFEGKKADAGSARIMQNTLRQADFSLSIPYSRPIIQNVNQGTWTATFQNTVVFTELTGAFHGLGWYLASNAPATSTTPAAHTGSALYVQAISPRTLVIDLVTPLFTLTAGTDGSAFAVTNFNLAKDGVIVADSINMTPSQLSTQSMSATNNLSYLTRQYPAYYLIPFGTDLNRDVWHQHGASSGLTQLNGNLSFKFNTVNNLTNTALYLCGWRAQELLYSMGNLQVISI